MHPLTHFIGIQQKNQSGCGLGTKFGQIKLNVVKKVKKWVPIISRFFLYFTWGIPFKAKVVVVHKPQSKFKANIARNAKFEGHLGLNFFPIWVRNGKKLIIFKNFTLVSQSLKSQN